MDNYELMKISDKSIELVSEYYTLAKEISVALKLRVKTPNDLTNLVNHLLQVELGLRYNQQNQNDNSCGSNCGCKDGNIILED